MPFHVLSMLVLAQCHWSPSLATVILSSLNQLKKINTFWGGRQCVLQLHNSWIEHPFKPVFLLRFLS